ncbi:MAG: hypothetical protein K2W89_07115, partial [Sphingomonas ginsenosidimutans]|nr:hypothetical protein [Sphingomonas ginsenosidimutans]
MMKALIAGLLAATAALPQVAMAQEGAREGTLRDVMRARMEARVEGQGRSADAGRWQRPERVERPQPSQPMPQAQPRPAPDRGGWQGER